MIAFAREKLNASASRRPPRHHRPSPPADRKALVYTCETYGPLTVPMNPSIELPNLPHIPVFFTQTLLSSSFSGCYTIAPYHETITNPNEEPRRSHIPLYHPAHPIYPCINPIITLNNPTYPYIPHIPPYTPIIRPCTSPYNPIKPQEEWSVREKVLRRIWYWLSLCLGFFPGLLVPWSKLGSDFGLGFLRV